MNSFNLPGTSETVILAGTYHWRFVRFIQTISFTITNTFRRSQSQVIRATAIRRFVASITAIELAIAK